MSPDIDNEKQRLAQDSFLKIINSQIRPTEMVTVYLDDTTDSHSVGIYCALIPNDQVERSINDRSWDLHLEDGFPGAVEYYRDGEKQVKYLRFGDDNGVEPLVICRGFHGMRPDYQEISEEFRLFHRLYYDRKQDQYIKIDDSGSECVVAIIELHRVQIRLQEIRQFLAIKDMHLVVMFDSRQDSTEPPDVLGLEEGVIDHRDGLLAYSLGYGDFEGLTGYRTFSHLIGKRLIPPLPKEKSGFWGFAQKEPKKCVEFIIGQDDDGTLITNSSDPDRLANLFGSNRGQPDYLTPVHFRRLS
jgi:hypothetical protein